MKQVYQYVVIFFNFQTTSNHLYPLQVENCGNNSWLVVDEDDYGNFRLERVNVETWDWQLCEFDLNAHNLNKSQLVYCIDFALHVLF